MKKYVLVIFAFVAATTFSAFTRPEKQMKVLTDNYFWYEIQNGQTVGDALNSSKEPRDVAIGLGDGCEEEDGTLCLAGFDEGNIPPSTQAPTPTTNGDNVIYKP